IPGPGISANCLDGSQCEPSDSGCHHILGDAKAVAEETLGAFVTSGSLTVHWSEAGRLQAGLIVIETQSYIILPLPIFLSRSLRVFWGVPSFPGLVRACPVCACVCVVCMRNAIHLSCLRSLQSDVFQVI